MCNKWHVQQLSIKFQFQTHNFQTIIYVAKFFKQLSINFRPQLQFQTIYLYESIFQSIIKQLSTEILTSIQLQTIFFIAYIISQLSIN